ncbi:hypothetical protein, partial [Kingella kingae]|uniref:hypothetical protein n=1 Tax=Kingella kingae TaxID=504 RepID=UPI00254EA79E
HDFGTSERILIAQNKVQAAFRAKIAPKAACTLFLPSFLDRQKSSKLFRQQNTILIIKSAR